MRARQSFKFGFKLTDVGKDGGVNLAQAFNGAVTHEFPVLGLAFVEDVLEQVKPQLGVMALSAGFTEAAFRKTGTRPEELMKAQA